MSPSLMMPYLPHPPPVAVSTSLALSFSRFERFSFLSLPFFSFLSLPFFSFFDFFDFLDSFSSLRFRF